MEETPVKSEFGQKLEPKPIVIIPDSFWSEHFVDISTLTSKREEDLKSTNCPQESNLSIDSELPTVNLNDDLNRWTVSSSFILPVEETENTYHVTEQSVDTGDRSVKVMLADFVKNEDICGTKIYELNEHTGQLPVIPYLTMNPHELKTDSDVLLSPLSLDDQLDHNNSCRDSEIKTSNVSTSTKDDKRLTHSLTSMKDTSEQSNDTPESQTLSADLSSNEQFDHSSTGKPEVNTFSGPTSTRGGKGERSFKCDICNKTFTQSSSLNAHQRIHTGERPYKCDICNKEFTWSDVLSAHRRIHTGEKPYTCDICNKTFTHSGNLRAHKLTHNSEKPHKCDVCNKTFTRRSYLRVHQRTHTGEKPFKCNICFKTFTQSSSLNVHQRIHTGERPYKCDVCHKTFAKSCVLNAHQRTHTGEKPYTCEVCNKTFTKSCGLSRHQRTHTGEKT